METLPDFSAAISELPPVPSATVPVLGDQGAAPASPLPDFTAVIGELPPARPVVDTAKDEEQLALNLRWRVANNDKAPEEQAEVLRLSSALGWKPEVVAADLPGARGAVEAQKLDSFSVVRDHPVLAGFIGDPSKTALARSDYDRLSALEKLTGRDAYMADGKLQSAVPGFFGRLFEGRRLNTEIKRLTTQLADGTVRDPSLGYEQVATGKEVRVLARQRPMTEAEHTSMWEQVHAAEAKLTELGVSGDTQFHEHDYVRNALANVAKIAVDMGPEMVASSMLGPFAAMYWGEEMRGGLYHQLHDAKRADGKTDLLTDHEASNWSFYGSIPLGMVMSGLPNAVGLGAGKVAMKVGAVERTVARIVPKAIDRLMTDRTFVGVAGHLAKEYGEAQLHGGLIMGLQSGIGQATLELAQASHGEGTDGRVMASFLQGAVRGMEDFAVISAFRPVANAVGNYGRWRRSADLASTLKDIADNTKNSRMAKASPEEFDKLVTQMGPNQTVHVDVEALSELAQKENVAPRELASRIVGDSGEAFDKATADGAMLPVPLGKWATNAVQKGLHERLAMDITPDPGSPTRRQALKEMADAQEFLTKRWEERQTDGVQVELDVIAEKMRAAATRIGKSPAEADTFARTFRGAVEVAAREFNVSVDEAAVKVRLPSLFLEELSGSSFGVLDGATRVASARNAPAVLERARRAAAAKAFDEHPAAKAWEFLRTGKSTPATEPLLARLREQAVASGKATAPKELLAEIEKVAKRVAKADGGAERGPLERRSATKRVAVRIESDPEGGAAVRLHDGKGEASHSVRIPSWLDAKDFAEHRAAWEHTWAALGGVDAPEQAQKLVFGYMRPSIEDGAAGPSKMGVMQAWAAGRLTQGLGGRGYAKVREALERWAAEPEGTRAADPIDPRAWGGLLAKLRYDEKWVSSGKFANKKKIEAFDRWHAKTQGELDVSRADYATRPPGWYGKPDAVDAGGTKAAATEALRARLTELNAQAREAALAGAEVSPKLDFAEAARLLGNDSTKLPTEAGGLSADELASVIGAPDGAGLLRDMVARKDRLAWIRGEAGKPTSLATEVAKELGVAPVELPRDLLSDAASKAKVEVTAPESDATTTVSRHDAELTNFLEQASLEGVILTRKDGSIHFRNPESEVWMWTEVNQETDTLDVSLLGVGKEGLAEGSKEWNDLVAWEKGKGYSSALYLKALQIAKLHGLGMRSDLGRTPATERMYERLNELGIPFKLSDEFIVDRYGLTAEQVAAIDVPAKWAELQARTKANIGELRQSNRGAIRMTLGPDGTPRDFIIRALAGDRSTLAHESSHFLSWSMHDMALDPAAPERLKADYAELLKFGGWKDASERLADNLERTKLGGIPEAKRTAAESKRLTALEAKEERISHAWEQYLAEGKAPAPELRSVFRRFREWMGRIYGSIEGIKKQYRDNYGQELELSDEVRGVFDRLIAVDRAVEQTKEGRVDYGALLNLTPEDAAAIAELRLKTEDEARDRLDRASAASQGRAAGAGGKLNAERELIRVSATQEYDESPGGITEHFLQTGTLRNKEGESTRPAPLASLGLVDESGRTMRLRYADVEALAGQAVAERLKAKGLTRDAGVHPDELALAFGWDSGTDMVRKLAEALPREQAIEAEVKARMEATFGTELELVTETVRSEMARATHGPSDLQEALRVRAALARELGQTKARLPAGVVRGAVEKAVAETKVGDVSGAFHLAAERKSAKQAFDLMAKAKKASSGGRTTESDFLYRQAQHAWDEVILNKHLVAASESLTAEMESAWKRVKKAGGKDWKSSLGHADISYSDATDAIRLAAGFEEGAKPDAGAIERALEAMRRDGGDVFEVDGKLQADGWNADFIRELAASPKEWDELTVEQAREVHNAVENIKAVASGKNAITLAGKKESRKNVVDATAKSLARFGARGLPRDPSALSPAARAAYLARKFMASIDSNLTEIEGLVDQITGNDRTHPLWRFMIEERLVAQDKELALSGKFAQRIQDLWDQLPPETAKRLREVAEGAGKELPVPDTMGILAPDSPMSIGQLIMVALNMGNEGNKQRLLDGMGWDEAQVLRTLGKHLTRGELSWVQGVWTALADLYPLIEETHIADQGLRPEKVAASPVRLVLADGSWVELEGGYFPARYDPRIPSKRPVPLGAVDGAGALRGPDARPAKVGNSHAQQRARENSDILNLDFHVVPAHVSQVLHDVTHRLWVKEAAGLVMDPAFRSMLRGTLGQEYEAIFPSYVRAVATKGATSVAGDTMRGWNAVLSFAKRKATLGAVGFNLSVAMADLTNPLLPLMAGEVSAERLASVTSQLAANWTDLRAFGLEHSIALRARMHHGSNTGEAIESIVSRRGAKGFYRDIEHAAYWMMETTDRMTATSIWLAKYQGLMADKTLEQAPEAHATAVREADALVRKYFPANDAASKAALLRDERFFGQTAFLYGFASKVYNFNRRTIVEAADAWRETGEGAPSRAAVIGRAMLVIGAQAAVMGVAGDFLASRGPKKDDDAKGVAKWAVARMLSTIPYQLPIINYLSPGTARGGLPGTSLMTRLYSEAKGAATGKVGGVELALALGAATVGGMAGFGQASKTGRYIDKGLKHDWQRHGAGSIASGLVFGQKASSELVTPLNMMEGK
jgi:hypothetical protein